MDTPLAGPSGALGCGFCGRVGSQEAIIGHRGGVCTPRGRLRDYATRRALTPIQKALYEEIGLEARAQGATHDTY